jgi:hypothetical protein
MLGAITKSRSKDVFILLGYMDGISTPATVAILESVVLAAWCFFGKENGRLSER